MDEKKIEYLKTHLANALLEGDYNEVNGLYRELLNHVSATDISDLAKKVAAFNETHAPAPVQENYGVSEDLKTRLRVAKKHFNLNTALQWGGLAGGLAVLVLGAIVVIAGIELTVPGNLDDVLFSFGIVLSITGFIGVLVGAACALRKARLLHTLNTCRHQVFSCIGKNVEQLNYLPNVEYNPNSLFYIGQLENNHFDGFGVALCGDGSFYVGEWKGGRKCGAGKRIADDLMFVLEGEFKLGCAHGAVDIRWEDGSEWHGEYRDDRPWNGRGKTRVKNKVLNGVWVGGAFTK